MLVTLYKIGEVQFRMFATNSFHVKAENERFAAAGSRCRQNLKYENFTSFLEVPINLIGRLRNDHGNSYNTTNQ